MGELYPHLVEALAQDRLVAVATVLSGPGQGNKMLMWPDGRRLGSLGVEALDEEVARACRELFQSQQPDRVAVALGEERADVFVDVHVPPPQLIIVGAVHIAIPLVTFACALGFRTVVIDARAAFATPERFGHADSLLVGWPADILADMDLNEATYLVTLTHDEKLDNPSLAVALKRPVRYVGALGSRRTHAQRVAALEAEGLSAQQISRIHAPIGLDLGGRRPEEIAVAIIAEIVAVRNGHRVSIHP